MAKYSEERFPAAPGPQITKKVETQDDNNLVRNLTQDDKPVTSSTIQKKSNQKLRKQK